MDKINENLMSALEEALSEEIQTQDVIGIDEITIFWSDCVNIIDNVYTTKGKLTFTVKGASEYSRYADINIIFTVSEDRISIIEQSTYITIGDAMLGTIDKTITLGMYLKAVEASGR